jgi:hypothetical protein
MEILVVCAALAVRAIRPVVGLRVGMVVGHGEGSREKAAPFVPQGKRKEIGRKAFFPGPYGRG